MASTFDDPPSDLDELSSMEEDIVDQLCTVDLDEDDDSNKIPSRPTSRLGFNSDLPLPEEDEVQETQFCVEQTDEIVAGDESDIAMSASIPDDADKPRARRSGDGWETFHEFQPINDDEDSEFELESDCYSCEGSDEESDTFLSSTAQPEMDTLVDPFSEATEESEWSLNPKFSCLPSPLSTHHISPSAASFRNTPNRHRYRHHGHSRHALLHLKWFWSAREDIWIEHKARLCESKAYGGLSIFSSVSPGLRLPSGPVPSHPDDTPDSPPLHPIAQLPPLSIHPRRGDLSALRDPYSVHIDRYFVGMPLWTMSKTLWMFDVHIASGDFHYEHRDMGDDLFDANESTSVGTLDSNAFSDDSDSTLVDSDSDTDIPLRTEQMKGDSKGSELESEASSSEIPLKNSESPSSSSASGSRLCSPPCTQWVTSWYRRWEVLLQLCVDNNPKTPDADATPEVPCSSSTKSPRFFIGGDSEDWDDVMEDEDYDDDDDDEDDDDDDEEDSQPAKKVLVVVNNENSTGTIPFHPTSLP
ncbi:hypothetical protein H0H92_002171 [Tricholoma furcatifolium]|nr:hypothetical protein H0H92_002171 [Tricholoma furcatifolium]